ncbi:MAG: peptide ABC transporter substrate-binding protein [Rhodobacterales bacterium]|nr:peptide ABC transporter substrate-binding protein [Rhodobacterales bacterium]
MALKVWKGLAVLLAVVLVLATTPSRAAPKDSLVIGISQFPSTFHPNIDSMMAKSYILAFTRRPMTTWGPDWKLACLLCTDLPTLENGGAVRETTPEGKPGVAVTYRIHPQATWGDGTPVTSRDVAFTVRVGRDPRSGFASAESYRHIHQVDTPDDKTVVLHVDKLDFTYNDLSTMGLIPEHLDREAAHDPALYRTRTTFDTDTTNPGLYFGPYRITRVVPGAHVVLEPNPTWYGPVPAFKRIVVRAIGNTAALEANLLSGEIDMIAGELGLTVDQALAFEKRHGGRYAMVYKPGLIYEHVDLNRDNPILQDARVRQALLLALDREALTQQLFAGRQPVAHTSINPLDPAFADDVPTYAHDPQRAADLLAEAGWGRLQGGVRVNDRGEPLRLEIMTTAGNRTRELVEQVLQSAWKQVGVQVTIRNEPARVFFGQTVTQRRYPAMAMYAWISAPESVPKTTLHSAYIPTEANNWAGQNSAGYANPEMDTLLDTLELEMDPEKRQALWRQLQHIYAADLPALPLYFRANAHIWPKWLTGVTPTGNQFPSSLWVERWGAK